MSLIPSFPYTLQNGTTADATQVMANFDQIQSDVNTYAAPLASPALSGTPTAPTATALTNNTQVATTAYADAAVAVATPFLVPTGVIVDYAGAAAPAGWLLCYGQSLARTGTYAALFAAIGTAYGSADGSHFNVPDLRGNVTAGADNMGGSAASRLTSATMSPDGDTLSATGGAQTNTLTTTQLPSHTHAATVSDSGHSHSLYGSTIGAGSTVQGLNQAGTKIIAGDDGAGGGTNGYVANAPSGGNAYVQTATTGISVSNADTGTGSAYSIIQPTVIVNKIIKI